MRLRRRSCSRFRGVAHRVVAGPARASARAAARLPRVALCPSAAAARPRPAEALFEALDSLVEPVLNRLFMPVQPAGAGTCAGKERDGLGSPTCTCRYARLLARAACQHEWGLHTAALLLERLLELLQLVLLLREQLEPIRLALRRFIEYGGRLCD